MRPCQLTARIASSTPSSSNWQPRPDAGEGEAAGRLRGDQPALAVRDRRQHGAGHPEPQGTRQGVRGERGKEHMDELIRHDGGAERQRREGEHRRQVGPPRERVAGQRAAGHRVRVPAGELARAQGGPDKLVPRVELGQAVETGDDTSLEQRPLRQDGEREQPDDSRRLAVAREQACRRHRPAGRRLGAARRIDGRGGWPPARDRLSGTAPAFGRPPSDRTARLTSGRRRTGTHPA